MNKMMKSFTKTAGLAALFAGGVSVAAVVGISGASAGDVSAPEDQIQEAASALAILDSGVTSADAIPEASWDAAAQFGESGLDLTSTRLIGEDASGTYWTGEDRSGNVCLVIELPQGGLSTGCTSVENFLAHGIALSHDQGGEYAEGYLLPDGVDVAIPEPLAELGTNLLVGDTRGLPSSERLIASSERSAGDDGSSPFSLQLLEPAGTPASK